MRVLVTGGAGFIGSELVHQLVQRGHQVTVLDNLQNGKEENLSDEVRLVVEDIRNTEVSERLLKEADFVFHLACLGVRHSLHSPLENHSVNAEGTLKLLALAKKVGIQRFIHVSTSEVYGTARWAPMTEDHPTFPLTVYGASKLAGECYARAYYESYQFPVIILRPFNTYGPRCHHEGDSGEVIPKFMLRSLVGQPLMVFGDGKQTRDFTYVEDMARNIIEAGFSSTAVGKTINLGSGVETSVNSLALQVTHLLGVQNSPLQYLECRPGDVLRLCADTSLAKKLFDFRCSTTFEVGLRKLHEWYQASSPSPEALLTQEVVKNWQEEIRV